MVSCLSQVRPVYASEPPQQHVSRAVLAQFEAPSGPPQRGFSSALSPFLDLEFFSLQNVINLLLNVPAQFSLLRSVDHIVHGESVDVLLHTRGDVPSGLRIDIQHQQVFPGDCLLPRWREQLPKAVAFDTQLPKYMIPTW